MPFMQLHPSKAVLPSGLVMANNVLRRNIFYYHEPKAKLFQLSNFPLDHNQSDYNLAYHFGHPVEIHWEVGKEIKMPAGVPRIAMRPPTAGRSGGRRRASIGIRWWLTRCLSIPTRATIGSATTRRR